MKYVATVDTLDLSERAPVKPLLRGGPQVEVTVKLSKRSRPYATIPLEATVDAKIVKRTFEVQVREGDEVGYVALRTTSSHAIDARLAEDVAAAADLPWFT